jgi:cytochrome c556
MALSIKYNYEELEMYKKLLLIALASVSFSTLTTASAFAAGSSNYTARDVRMPIMVTSAERNQVLYEMRSMLHGMVNLHSALAKEDYKGVATAARSMGPLYNNLPASIKDRAPEEFTQLGIALHESFEALAKEAEAKGTVNGIQSMLSETMTYCSGCHDTYRFDVRSKITKK